MKIIPTVGRVVYVRIAGLNDNTETQQPLAALIVHVHSEDLINVAGWDANGCPMVRTSLPLLSSEAPLPETGTYAHWMAYQVKAHEGAEAKAVASNITATIERKL